MSLRPAIERMSVKHSKRFFARVSAKKNQSLLYAVMLGLNNRLQCSNDIYGRLLTRIL